jgi:hypothetical protein
LTLKALVILITLLSAMEVLADTMASMSLKWASFSFQPKTDEPTPNYESFALRGVVGLTWRSGYELGLMAEYLPSRLGSATWNPQEAEHVKLGALLMSRIDDALVFGLSGGKSVFRLFNKTDINEVEDGSWSGNFAGLQFGGIYAEDRDSSQRIMVHFESALLTHDSTGETNKINEFGISLTYVFQDFVSSLSKNKIFRGFLNL